MAKPLFTEIPLLIFYKLVPCINYWAVNPKLVPEGQKLVSSTKAQLVNSTQFAVQIYGLHICSRLANIL